MRPKHFLTAILLSVPLLVSAMSAADLYDEAADPTVQLRGALESSKSSGKPVLVQVGANWCSDTQRLDAFYRSHPELRRMIKDEFVLLRINRPSDGGHEEFFATLPEFSWIPTLIVLGAGRQVLAATEGTEVETPEGYEEEKILSFLRGALE